ncbi:MAG: radical SAM protein [Nitrospirae bacterium]|nr:radical SAM protein [Nitrospirota bacterium]
MTYSPFRHIPSILWKRSPIHLTFFLTRRCNSRCPFCFYLSKKKNPPPYAKGGNTPLTPLDRGELSPPLEKGDIGGFFNKTSSELSLDEIEKISSSLGSLLWLAFSGGEIFLRDDIVEITKIFYERNKPAIILFPTNGLLTDVIGEKIEAVLNYCKKSTIVVKLSLEGMEELHDSIRGTRGSFQKTMQTYNALRELLEMYPNFDLGVNTVFNSENQGHMDELIGFVNGLDGIRTHTVSLIRGKVSDQRLKDIDVGKYQETINRMALNSKNKVSSIYRFKGARLKAAQDILQRRLIHETIVKKKQVIPCYAGRLNLVITESGDVYPCESFNMKMGSVRKDSYDLNKILKSEQAQDIIRSIRSKGCYCTHECYMMTNILFNPVLYPALMKEYMQL